MSETDPPKKKKNKHKPRLYDFEVKAIRMLARAGDSTKELADWLGVPASTVNSILKGKTYKDVK